MSGISSNYTTCVDLHGKEIPHGYLYSPGPDTCQICTCFSGHPGLCRTVLCGPPLNCRSIRVHGRCCEWTCLDDDDPNSTSAGLDLGLRLLGSGVTAVLSLALLFFLVFRLRQHQRLQRLQRSSEEDNEESGLDLSVNGGRSLWKPPDDLDDGMQPRTLPPSYDEATMNDDDDEGSCESLEDAEVPDYSQIHLDPVIPQPQQEGVRHHHTLPCGATLVLPGPAPPISTLHHVEPHQN